MTPEEEELRAALHAAADEVPQLSGEELRSRLDGILARARAAEAAPFDDSERGMLPAGVHQDDGSLCFHGVTPWAALTARPLLCADGREIASRGTAIARGPATWPEEL